MLPPVWNPLLPLILPISCIRKRSRHFFCPPKSHLLGFQVKQVDVILAANHFPSKTSRCDFGGMIILPAKMTSTYLQVDLTLAGKDIAIVSWYKMRCTEFLCEQNSGIPNFGIGIPI
jgi:hypothetical protein